MSLGLFHLRPARFPAPMRFMHVPKTGGVTLVSILDRIYRAGGGIIHLEPPVAGVFGSLQRDIDWSAVRLLTGHTSFELGIAELDRLPCVTLIRHPVARVRSYCQHVSEGKSRHLRDRYPPERFDLDGFLGSGDGGLENLQVRKLSNCAVRLDHGNFRPYLERAVHVLRDRMVCFGLTERFDESLLLMKGVLAWPWPVYLRLNAADRSRRLLFTREHDERIRELNFADLLLYEAARQIFDQRMRQHADLRPSLQIFRMRQQLHRSARRIEERRARWSGGRRAGTAAG